MTHYASTYHVHHHDNRCYISIRSTENRVDTFIFSKQDIHPVVGMSQEDEWIGSKNLSIKINTQKSKATIKIDKGHCIVSYSSGIHEIQKLLAQIEDVYFKLHDSVEVEEPAYEHEEQPDISTTLLEAMNAMMLRHNQILLHEITLKLKKILGEATPAKPAKPIQIEDLPKSTSTFIPSDIGKSLTGNMKAKSVDSSIDVKDLANKLKSLKDTENG